MRRHQYPDSAVNPYATSQMQHNLFGQRTEHKSGKFQGRTEALTAEKEGQWRWERDVSNSKVVNTMSSHMFNEGEAGGDASRPFYQSQRPDSKLGLEKQVNIDPRSQPHEEEMDIGYEEKTLSPTFEGLEEKFLDDIMKLTKEQTDAEDAEIARHRERINAINAQYQDQLAALRVRHANQRDEFLRSESHARQTKYQQAQMDHYPNSGMGPSEPHAYGGVPGESHRPYNTTQIDSYSDRVRFLGGRDQGFEPRGGPYPGGRAYDTGSRYY